MQPVGFSAQIDRGDLLAVWVHYQPRAQPGVR
jgi:hypothetical protein